MVNEPVTESTRPKLALAERAKLLQMNRLLEQRLREMRTLFDIGKAVAAATDLDTLLTRIVEAAVFLLHAEEGSLLLLDPTTNELYLRAQKGLGEKQARRLKIRVEDTLIGGVVRTGKPVILGRSQVEDGMLKVVTGYLVHALLYVPLKVQGQVIGVLGVDNQTTPRDFTRHDERLLSALADYAAIAIQNAQLRAALARMRPQQERGLPGQVRAEVQKALQTIAGSVRQVQRHLTPQDMDALLALGEIEKQAAHIGKLIGS